MPKKLPKPKKRVKTPVVLKTLEERQELAERIKGEFLKMGCYPGLYPAADQFFKILDDYQNEGVSASGKIDFPECPYGGREIYFILTNRANVENVVHFLMKERKEAL